MKLYSNVSTAGPRTVTIRVDLDGTVRVNFAAPPWYQPELMEDFIIPRGHGVDVVVQVLSHEQVPLKIELERDVPDLLQLFGGTTGDLTEDAVVDLAVITHRMVITADNLPKGPRWEQDGSCWEARKWPFAAEPGWRWCPMNSKAFTKGEPQGDMTDHAPLVVKP